MIREHCALSVSEQMTCLTAAKLCFSVSRSLCRHCQCLHLRGFYSSRAVDASSASVHHLWHTLALRKERKKEKKERKRRKERRKGKQKKKESKKKPERERPLISSSSALEQSLQTQGTSKTNRYHEIRK